MGLEKFSPSICPVCNKYRSNGDHRKCAKITKAKHDRLRKWEPVVEKMAEILMRGE